MLKCRELSERASEILEGRLSWRAGMPARVHLMMCRHCRQYFRQLELTVGLIRGVQRRSAPADALRELQVIDRLSKG